jgi:uncharacterized protein (DUF1800 family)
MRYKTIGPVVLVFLLFFLSASTVSPAPWKASDEQQIKHVLNRLGFGVRPGDIERVQKLGIREYIEQQLHPERINDALADEKVLTFSSLGMKRQDLFEEYPNPQQLARQLGLRNPNQKAASDAANTNPTNQKEQAAARRKLQEYMKDNMLQRPQQLLQELISNRVVRGVHSERQLQEVMTDFWFNHFNIYWDKGADRWLTTDFEMNVIRPRVLGKFKDLLQATAQSPAMLFYLDNHLSTSPTQLAESALRRRANNPNAKRKPGINENYARELMELHTLGVDGGYTQKDVTEVARALTGWTIDQPRMNASFIFRPQMHDRGEKTVLGQRIAANGGIQDGQRVIDILANHPSTARFISTKLVRRFVSDNPPQSLVDKVAATYTKTDGDIREMLRTIFYSEEFLSPASYGQKMKSPFEYAVSSIRALYGATDGNPQIGRAIGQMGQPLYQYQAPTGFPDRADQWMGDGALIARLNFAVSLTSGQIPARVNLYGFKDAQAAALYLGSPDFQKR